jgi:predicted metal-dependent hydrolase
MNEIKRRPLTPIHEYAEGELFLFLGRSYPLHIMENGSMAIERTDRLHVSSMLIPAIRNQLKHWYREEARKEIQARCMWFSLKTGHVPATIRITDARQ